MGTMKSALRKGFAMSESLAMNHTALKLQLLAIMKSILVGFLAVAMLGGCGVGADDLEGAQAASGHIAQELTSGPPAPPGRPGNSTGAQGEKRSPVIVVGLPQDPIPVFEGKTAGSGPPIPPK